ncbi:MAG TPA: helix-turn-helix domain-containing protein [Actinomycetota bacterium]|nr:helix-turn-helix domain-containing protein [Actinomycetota bacterium]
MPTEARSARRLSDDDQFVIKDLETLKALADPLRVRFLLELTYGPRTVKDVAKALGVRPTRLYYHLRILEKHGLVRVAARRMVSGIEERSYETTARSWTFDKSLMAADIVRTGIVKSMFDVTAAELELVLDREPDALGDDRSIVPTLVFTRLLLDPDDLEEFVRRMDSVMEDFSSDVPIAGKTEYHAVLAAYRLPRPEEQ